MVIPRNTQQTHIFIGIRTMLTIEQYHRALLKASLLPGTETIDVNLGLSAVKGFIKELIINIDGVHELEAVKLELNNIIIQLERAEVALPPQEQDDSIDTEPKEPLATNDGNTTPQSLDECTNPEPGMIDATAIGGYERPPLLTFEADDIDYQLAVSAHSRISFDPEKRAKQVRSDYVNDMQEALDEFSVYATDDNYQDLKRDLEKYKEGYIEHLNAVLHARSGTASSGITGAANFAVERNRRAMETEQNRLTNFIEYCEKALDRLRNKYNPNPESNSSISADDANAQAKLQDRIDTLEAKQQLMKAANKIIFRRNLSHEEKMQELVKLDGISENTAKELLTSRPGFGIGFPGFELTNNNKEIKRNKDRLEYMKYEQDRRANPIENKEIAPGVRITENNDSNRLEVYFNEKPSEETRNNLKKNGFKWSPMKKAWQRQLNNNARDAIERIFEVSYDKLTESTQEPKPDQFVNDHFVIIPVGESNHQPIQEPTITLDDNEPTQEPMTIQEIPKPTPLVNESEPQEKPSHYEIDWDRRPPVRDPNIGPRPKGGFKTEHFNEQIKKLNESPTTANKFKLIAMLLEITGMFSKSEFLAFLRTFNLDRALTRETVSRPVAISQITNAILAL